MWLHGTLFFHKWQSVKHRIEDIYPGSHHSSPNTRPVSVCQLVYLVYFAFSSSPFRLFPTFHRLVKILFIVPPQKSGRTGEGRKIEERSANRIRKWTGRMIGCTVLVLRMAHTHRIWKETKQQPGTAEPGNMLGCCLISLHFLWGILSTSINRL